MRAPRRRSSARRCQTGSANGSSFGASALSWASSAAAVDRLVAEAAAQRVVVQQQLVDPAREQVGVGEVAHPDRPARDLVLVGRADAAAGGADLAGAAVAGRARPLAGAVELAVQRQDQRRVLGDAQVVRADRDALARAGVSISSSSAQGSITTPLPMIESLPGRTTPEGSRLSL